MLYYILAFELCCSFSFMYDFAVWVFHFNEWSFTDLLVNYTLWNNNWLEILIWKMLNLQNNPFFECRNKILCHLWAWGTAHGESPKSYLWIVHRLCVEESLLWNGDAHSVWAIWCQSHTGNTKRSCSLVESMKMHWNMQHWICCLFYCLWFYFFITVSYLLLLCIV